MLLLFGRFSPFCRRAPCLGLEDAVEMGAAGKSALGRNDIVAVVGILQHHLLGCIETDPAKPYPEVGMQTLVEEQTQFVLRNAECVGKYKHIHVTVLVALILTPGIQALLNKVPAFIRNNLQFPWFIIRRILLYVRIILCPPISGFRWKVVFRFLVQELFGRNVIAAKGYECKVEEQQCHQPHRSQYI